MSGAKHLSQGVAKWACWGICISHSFIPAGKFCTDI